MLYVWPHRHVIPVGLVDFACGCPKSAMAAAMPVDPVREMALGKYYATARADTLAFWTHEGERKAYFQFGNTELHGSYEIENNLIKVCWTKKIWSKPGRSQRIENAVEIREEMMPEENFMSARFRDGLYRHQHLVGEDDD
ncbi:unnamed protein product [Effrenium voratum]|nr:unnamed protein product [Effrenium voratum]